MSAREVQYGRALQQCLRRWRRRDRAYFITAVRLASRQPCGWRTLLACRGSLPGLFVTAVR
jgi:hypothetical protein